MIFFIQPIWYKFKVTFIANEKLMIQTMKHLSVLTVVIFLLFQSPSGYASKVKATREYNNNLSQSFIRIFNFYNSFEDLSIFKRVGSHKILVLIILDIILCVHFWKVGEINASLCQILC